ncbi:MAG: branched-chain amino acid ABC transporter permease, partial [Rhodospirillaceae bacterium]
MKYLFEIVCLLLIVAAFAMTQIIDNQFVFFVGFVILQYVVMSTAWNVLGGYAGYVNFGSAGFLAVGAYTSVALINFLGIGLVEQFIIGGIVAGLLGLATGYLTLRLRGVYFAIATLALAIILETIVAHWDYVGGAAGTSIHPKRKPELLGVLVVDRKAGVFSNYKEFLFFLMVVVSVGSVWVARWIENSKLGRGLNAIKDSEEAAECMGVPT